MTANNLNLALCFDQSKKFLICGELVKFHLKVTSPEFEGVPEEFIERIAASVESIEITEESSFSMSTTASSSLESFRGSKKMKSVESLSNLLKVVDQRANGSTHQHNHSKDSQNSQHSMSSVTARRFNSLNLNRSGQNKPFWCTEESAILIPLEAFIDPECLSSSAHKAAVKFKVSLNELVPLDPLESLRIGFNDIKWTDCVSSAAQSSHKLEKIGQVESSLTVLRPLEVSLRTHSLSSTQAILQIIVEFNHEDEAADLNGNLEIEVVDIVLSDSFASRSNSNLFKISSISERQVPFTFEKSPQQYSLLFNWTLLKQERRSAFEDENFQLRVEIGGNLKNQTNKSSELSLSFESSVPIFNLFPLSPSSGLQITSTKLIGGSLKVFEHFQLELILHNYDDEMKSIHLDVVQNIRGSNVNNYSKTTRSPVEEWFHMERVKRSPGVVVMSPLTTLKVENIPSGGSKAIRLKLLPMKCGIFNLKEELKIINSLSGKTVKFDQIIIRVDK